MIKITRRTLLKISGSALLSAPLLYVATPARAAHLEIDIQPAKHPFGRAIQARLPVREQPSTKAVEVRKLARNEVVQIIGQTVSDESPTTYNKIWYQLSDGWVHSALVQPCENSMNTPIASVAPDAITWGEVTVPLVAARLKADADARAAFTYYYGNTYQVMEVVEGADKKPWYRLSDGAVRNAFAPAEQIRIIPLDEFTPISPDVPADQKHIDVDLKQQLVTAYEADKPVFTARCASGAAFKLVGGERRSFRTPSGTHHIYRKTPSQRMIGGTAGDADFYDLPGIAWVSYFTYSGCAFHGTYWHNDYGQPRSHGCVNLVSEDAKWIYRWTMPTSPYDQRWTRADKRDAGTLVHVF